MIDYKCARCATELETEDSLASKTEPCPICGYINTVPKTKQQLKEERLRQKATELAKKREKEIKAKQDAEEARQTEKQKAETERQKYLEALNTVKKDSQIDKNWYCCGRSTGKVWGPMPESQLQSWISLGRINSNDMVHPDNIDTWIKVSDIPEIFVCPEDSSKGDTVKDQSLINLKTTTTSDKILRLAFRFAKGISAIIVAICFITLIVCVIALFVVQPEKVPVRQQLSLPDFSKFKQQVENQRTQQTTQNASEYTRQYVSPSQSIEGQFGKQLDDLCTKYDLIDRQTLIRWLVELQNQNQTLFLSGLKTFLADAQEYKRQNQSAFTYANFADYYHEAFGQAEQQYEADIASALAHNRSEMERIDTIRKLILMSLVGSIGCLLAFLILPLLIQIECNTRVLLAEK